MELNVTLNLAKQPAVGGNPCDRSGSTGESRPSSFQMASEAAHYYSKDGSAQYFIKKKTGEGLRPTTIKDARKNGWLPSPTTILATAAKPALNRWLQENAIIAAVSTPMLPGEPLDEFVKRVLSVDSRSISDAAKERGTQIHATIEKALLGESYDAQWAVYVEPVLAECAKFGKIVHCEKVVVGEGYAGKLDALFRGEDAIRGVFYVVVDFKTASKLPKAQYDDHLAQLSAYAKAIVPQVSGLVYTANIYISTTQPGEVVTFENSIGEWENAFKWDFTPCFTRWQYLNNYFCGGNGK